MAYLTRITGIRPTLYSMSSMTSKRLDSSDLEVFPGPDSRVMASTSCQGLSNTMTSLNRFQKSSDISTRDVAKTYVVKASGMPS